MQTVNEFPPEVAEKLGYYVYRLIDPRNGQTFYVGKGRGNRVFQHVKCAIGYYDGADNSSEDDPNKFKIIHAILQEGMEVIHVIQRWNLTEREALQVEAALIDCYQGLTNLQRGYHADDYGVTNAQILIRRFACQVYDEPNDFKYLIIKVQQWRLDDLIVQHGSDTRYEATRWCWHIRPRSIDEFPYVFSVTGGIVREVYAIERWLPADEGRYAFEGKIAPQEIRERFIGLRIPDKYSKKGMASPVLFSKNQTHPKEKT